MRNVGLLCGVFLALCGVSASHAQENFPNKPITIVVAGGAGGNIDATARMLADKMSKKWGQPVLVEARPGAGGSVAADYVSRANPDGYTLLMAAPAPLVINEALYGSLSYDPKELASISVVNSANNTVVVSKNVAAKNFEEFLAYAKSHPGEVSYASQGIGTLPHLGSELLKTVAGIDLLHVPFRSTATAMNDVAAGNVDMMILMPVAARNLVESSGAKILAVASREHLPELPDVPTLDELGVPGVYIESWNAIAAPPGTPEEIVNTLNEAVLEAQADPDTQKQIAAIGMVSIGSTPAEMDAFLEEERVRWEAVIKEAHITATADAN
ncbi:MULTISPECIES: tripartite tricarboxylate transporter substrate-binding protein [Chelativorans]|uniref:Uncharacterized protein UPF0065 n=1 Tax=Chelativorans sp. (strain BNC1) TaxID=266779 RepID=Q11E71_CHESB